MATLRILVVDDDDLALEYCAQALRGLNDTEIVLENHSPNAADRLAREPFDLLISDLRMPGLDGLELVRLARRTNPGLPALIVTGYPAEAFARMKADDLELEYLAKPFDPEQLLASARALLKNKRPGD